MFRLISATSSPYARKVRIALTEKALPFELITEVPWHNTTQTPKYNPLEKLPVLLTPDGDSIYESSYILQYLELKYPDPPLLPPDIDGLLAARKLEVLCDGICDAFVLIFFERMRENGRSAVWLERQQRKIDNGLEELARLIGPRRWAVGDQLGLGDIATGTLLAYFDIRNPALDWRKRHPNLAAYCDRLAQHPSFRSSVPVPQVLNEKVV